MAARGDVLALRRAVGFLPNARLERFVVIQADEITRVTETVLVAPLDDALGIYSSMPGAVQVSGSEGGSERKQVVLLTQIMTLPIERFDPVAVGRLGRPARVRMDGVLRLVLDLV